MEIKMADEDSKKLKDGNFSGSSVSERQKNWRRRL